MGMMCNQCQETARNNCCEFGGVCGKSEDLADLQDLLIYTLKGISEIIIKGKIEIKYLSEINREVAKSLFMTITNANFDEKAIMDKIKKMIALRNNLREKVLIEGLHDAAIYEINTDRDMLFKASYVGITPNEDKDITSLKQLITFGLKGLAAYIYHALNLEKEKEEIYCFLFEALSVTLQSEISIEELIEFAMKTGEFGVKAMALLDEANTSKYGNPEITQVNIGVRNNPAILISGHDLTDLELLLEQTKGTGVDVYTHSEMLPANYYPVFKQYEHLVGNYGNAWWQQEKEFNLFNGPILFTTNCIVPHENEDIKARIFTTGAAGYPGCFHIKSDAKGNKDFTKIIELAKKLRSPTEIEKGKILGGFAHNQFSLVLDKVETAIRNGEIKKFIVMAGCDGRMESREYYSQFAKKLPKDTVILTAGCAKYRFIKLDLGEIMGIPRILDAGQCNDSYSLVMIALKLKEVFELNDINDLPIAYNISWYEQKAVLVLLSLLFLGVKNIHLGPSLPAFLSPNVTKMLVENFGLIGISSVEEDLHVLLGDIKNNECNC